MEAVSKKAKEADVEARVVMPLLTLPELLGIPHQSIQGKKYLYPRHLDKAAGKTTGYYPDFSVWEGAFPVVIVEAKAPSVEAAVGYREAGLYAHHLNKQYKAGLNPCGYLISTNGQQLLAGHWDADPEIDVQVADIVPGEHQTELLRDRVRHDRLRQLAADLAQQATSRVFYFGPRGSNATTLTNSRVLPNRFASVLVPTLTRYFSSPTDENDPAVYDTGYVATDEQISYDNVLESMLKERAHAHKNPLARDIRTSKSETKTFTQRISEYSTTQRNTPQIVLIVGHVGAGKSLFIRRYKEVLLPATLRQSVYWSFLNFNDIDLDGDATDRISDSFIEGFKKEHPQVDLYDEATQNHVFSEQLNKQKAIYERLARVSEASAELQRAGDISKWIADPQVFSKGITRYYGGEAGATCIAVFDNVDKLDKDDQLKVFQLAVGFTSSHRTMTVLQLRDETFERYKDVKPLDTFRTGVSFHITPPRFGSVVRRRLEIASEDLRTSAPKEWEYELANGVRVRISREQALNFLKDIYDYVFDKDQNTSRLLQGLAGRDVRRALNIFFSVMVSGHLASDQITSVALQGTGFPITADLLLRAVMRGDYRFFHEGSGFTANLFYIDREWDVADNFLIPEILYFLASRIRTRGTIGIEGFYSVEAVAEHLQILGYRPSGVAAGCQWLLTKGLLEADNMSTSIVSPATSLKISSSGFMHIRVLSERLEYMAACLYEMPFLDKEAADQVAGLLQDSLATGGLSPTRKAQALQNFRKYLRELLQHRNQRAPNLTGIETGAEYVLAHLEKAIAERIRPLNPPPASPDPLDV